MDDFKLDVSGFSYQLSKTPAYHSYVQLGEKTLPLNVHLDTDTDWAIVLPSVASIVVASVVAWLTVKIQRTQINANLSNFRQQWMVELRDCASQYLRALFSMSMRISTQKDFRSEPRYFELHEEIAALTCKFEMLLSRNDAQTEKIFELDAGLLDDINNLEFDSDPQVCIDKINEMKQLLRNELESAWQDVKSDYGSSEKPKRFAMLARLLAPKMQQ